MTFIIGPDKEKIFNLRLLNLEYDELDVPEIKYDCKMKLSSSKFANICKDLSLLSENVRITNDNKEQIIASKIKSLIFFAKKNIKNIESA